VKRAVLFAATMFVAAAAWTQVAPAVPVSQPLAFNHAKHTAALTCTACHQGAMAGVNATLPSGGVCIKCHASAPPSVAPALWKAVVEAEGPPRWVPVTRLPAHVLFSHRRHTALGGLACESCHGDIGTRTSPPTRAAVRLDMKTCLACHKQEGASEDCAGCHR